MKYLTDIGSYFIMLKNVFSRPTKASVMRELIFKEIDELVINSLGIVAFISFFVGRLLATESPETIIFGCKHPF